MQSWLEANTALSGVSTQCYADSPIGKAVKTSVGAHTVAAGAMKTGTACTPAATTLKMKWNSHASEWGAYEITGCTGVNPKLSLVAGTEYTFDQSDASNRYHHPVLRQWRQGCRRRLRPGRVRAALLQQPGLVGQEEHGQRIQGDTQGPSGRDVHQDLLLLPHPRRHVGRDRDHGLDRRHEDGDQRRKAGWRDRGFGARHLHEGPGGRPKVGLLA